jgi:anti-sigma regulatory factor (Ser/Thr protein kinase)
MHTMVPGRAAEIQACRVRLAPGPAAVAEARGRVRAAIAAWKAPVDEEAAALLTSELVTNAVRHTAGGTVTLGIRCTRNRLRVDVHDMSPSPPVLTAVPADAETGRGLMLVAGLSAEWGCYRTPGGKVVYFTLAFQPGPGQAAP